MRSESPAHCVKPYPRDYNVKYLKSEVAVNQALAAIKDGCIGFDAEMAPRIPAAEETLLATRLANYPAHRKGALLGWQILQAEAATVFPITWDNVGLCIIQIARKRTVWVINLTMIKGIILARQLRLN